MQHLRELILLTFVIGPGLAAWMEKISRQSDNVLIDFAAYRHVSIVHFDLPENTVSVGFKFIVKEEKTGGIGDCIARDVTINLKSGSLPLVRPDGSRIEAKLLDRRRRNYTVEASSNNDEHIVNIVAPPPGDWYAIAYRSWTDPNTNKIKQQGLGASCDTVLNAELSIETADLIYLVGNSEYTAELNRTHSSAVMQFRVPKNTKESTLNIRSTCGSECSVALHVTTSDHLISRIINSTEDNVEFMPYDDDSSIHYVTLKLEYGNASTLTVALDHEDKNLDNALEVKLIRQSLPDFFLFDYEHLPGNSTKSGPFNFTAGSLSIMRFKIGEIYDTGGTLSIGLRIADPEERKDKVVIVGCVSLGYYSSITPKGNCIRSDQVHTSDVYVSNRTSPDFVHIPFPEPGYWHLSLRAFCLDTKLDDLDQKNHCECFEECSKNITKCNDSCECARECNARVETSISSSPCIEGGCNSHGKCLHYMSGGIVYSACHCTGGWRGFDCADNEYVLSRADVLARLLMLTLSNLAFIGAIYVAIRRFYFTEAIVYAAVMIFSTFYHACEAGEEGHTFCMMKLSVLQFCDFYNALLSIWVTLVAMASMGPRPTSFCQMLGVIILAVGAEMDRTALWVFLLPAISGCLIVIISWAIKCRQKGTLLYPARTYRLVYLPVGLIVVFVGLICYAFLQTRSNYYIVHSMWHICVAAGAALLLPKREYME